MNIRRFMHVVCTALLALSAISRAQPGEVPTYPSPLKPPTYDSMTYPGFDVPPAKGIRDWVHAPETLQIHFYTTRYIGPTSPFHIRNMIDAGAIEEFATLNIASWGSKDAIPGHPRRDIVYFNGERVDVLNPLNPYYLQDGVRTWQLSTFRIPMYKVRFPTAPGLPGQPPAWALNTVDVYPDPYVPSPPYEVYGCAVDWASLSIKVASPVVLVPGNSLTSAWWGLTGFTTGLVAEGLSPHPISLAAPNQTSWAANAAIIKNRLQGLSLTLGTDKFNLVAHSKGGLDCRIYLSRYHRFKPLPTYDIVSLTTLSTPHNGSLLADLLITRQAHAAVASRSVEFANFPWLGDTMLNNYTVNGGYPFLTTWICGTLNTINIPQLRVLSKPVVFNAMAADLDQNGDGVVNSTPDEYSELAQDNWWLRQVPQPSTPGRVATDVVYQTLRGRTTITVAVTPRPWAFGRPKTLATITGVVGGPFPNDILVTTRSGMGVGSYNNLIRQDQYPHTLVFSGPTTSNVGGKNHTSIGNASVGGHAATMIIYSDKANGGLR